MLKTERKQLILEELNQHHVVSLEKLVSLLETLRINGAKRLG